MNPLKNKLERRHHFYKEITEDSTTPKYENMKTCSWMSESACTPLKAEAESLKGKQFLLH